MAEVLRDELRVCMQLPLVLQRLEWMAHQVRAWLQRLEWSAQMACAWPCVVCAGPQRPELQLVPQPSVGLLVG